MRTVSSRDRRGRANLLASCGLAAAVVAVITAMPVIGDRAFAVKFETGQLPAGFDPIGAQAAMVLSVGSALAAVGLIVAGLVVGRTWFTGGVAALCALAAPFYGLLAFVSVQLAFG